MKKDNLSSRRTWFNAGNYNSNEQAEDPSRVEPSVDICASLFRTQITITFKRQTLVELYSRGSKI